MKKGFESIRRGLEEAVAHAQGKGDGVRVHRPRPVDVKALRTRIGLSQTEFAERFGVSVATLRHWERGDRAPHGPALVLLNVIDRNPGAVMDALID
ncbi:helix-turn-helix domain-containing protein [Quisquiliibacterium transsilvanicum]|jgi:putative transcriptional regulator|uniref:Putative transcriptional regulator n=1 Tax=Quisquiliibacterium transsilvanicum TaxID=1549638 RepID=A0A7W8HF95_9BURK|nr:helix-turn-helix domain-containing protein [Quisquiliibacterium transsilvanicum]MBB5270920.1 putative transcriptional regulator [Quisquiliibacterium transsilvanicum]